MGSVHAQVYSVLRSFTNMPDAATPYAGLVLGSNTLYGTTIFGGTSGWGSIFKINTDGSGYQVLKSFSKPAWSNTLSANTNADGYEPVTSLVLDGGTLYGTADGGTNGGGVLFRIGTDSSGYTVLFNSDTLLGELGQLTLFSNVLYGTASSLENDGSIFRINVDGTGLKILKTYSGSSGNNFTNADGVGPTGPVAVSADGTTLYGATRFGGPGAEGTIFKIGTDGKGFQMLTNFGGPYNPISEPMGGLIINGNALFGTCSGGKYGNVFEINTDGTGLTNFSTVATNNPIGQSLEPIFLWNGTLYGTTWKGGSSTAGVVFRVDTNGNNFSVIKNLRGGNGSMPYSSVVVSNGVIYGTTHQGGTKNQGVVFKIDLTSVPVVDIQTAYVASNYFYLGWNSITGEQYQIQYLTDLSQTNWHIIDSVTASNNPVLVGYPKWTDRQRFYRVVYQP